LIRYARSKRKTVITGAEVIVLQAVEQFVLYTGVRPSGEQIERAFAIASVALQPAGVTLPYAASLPDPR
jgi:shikimate 5-dehydrogenase